MESERKFSLAFYDIWSMFVLSKTMTFCVIFSSMAYNWIYKFNNTNFQFNRSKLKVESPTVNMCLTNSIFNSICCILKYNKPQQRHQYYYMIYFPIQLVFYFSLLYQYQFFWSYQKSIHYDSSVNNVGCLKWRAYDTKEVFDTF